AASRVSLRRERKLRIFQPDADSSIDFDERRGRVVRREPDDTGQPSLTFENLEVHDGDALGEEIDAFVQAVRARQPPPVTGWDGLRALEGAGVVRERVERGGRAAHAPPHPSATPANPPPPFRTPPPP